MLVSWSHKGAARETCVYLWIMGKLQERRAELAQRIQSVRSKKILDAVEQALAGEVEPELTDEEYEEMQAIKRRYQKGESKGSTWPEVKKRLMRELRS